MPTQTPTRLRKKIRLLTAVSVLLWFTGTLLPIVMARSKVKLGSWPLDFWLAAQGSILIFLLIVTVYAWLVNRWEAELEAQSPDPSDSRD